MQKMGQTDYQVCAIIGNRDKKSTIINDACNASAEYFTGRTVLVCTIPPPSINSFVFLPTKQQEVRSHIRNMKNTTAVAVDGIPQKIIKSITESIINMASKCS